MDAGRFTADDLWWSWAVTATRTDLPEDVTVSFTAEDHLLSLDRADAWLRMQRLRGGRALVWGRVTFPPAVASDVLAGVPDWASSDAVFRSANQQDPEFLAWYARGEWDSSDSDDQWRHSLPLFDLMREADPGLVRAARRGETDEPLLVAAQGAASLNAQGAMRKRLRAQIHGQMRDACEVDRALPSRPTLLARWLRINTPVVPFRHVVAAREGTVVVVLTEPPLPADQWASLTNVLQQLWTQDAGEESGAWLVAQVVYDGLRITLERAFDSLPPWFDGKGPRLAWLSWEMRQRSAQWRPGWASLLPD